MRKSTCRRRGAFLVWWNEVATLHEDASRYELAELAWQEAKRQTRKRREQVVFAKDYEAAIAALRELVELKDLHDQFDAMKQDVPHVATAAVLEGIGAEYRRRKPAAWERARSLVSASVSR